MQSQRPTQQKQDFSNGDKCTMGQRPPGRPAKNNEYQATTSGDR